MDSLNLSATDMLIWGIVAHLIGDWVLQNDWMARNKAAIHKHPAGWVHGAIHGLLLAPIFTWYAIPIALLHVVIDTRRPVQWWSKLIRQTQPTDRYLTFPEGRDRVNMIYQQIWDGGTETRVWLDQVFHIGVIAAFALLNASA